MKGNSSGDSFNQRLASEVEIVFLIWSVLREYPHSPMEKVN